MGDKADAGAQTFAWEKLQGLAAKLGASLIATAGNHDMDSRHTTEHDAKGILQSLTPMFPGLPESDCDRYWARNFVVVDTEPHWRMVVLNSSAYHGGGTPKDDPDFATAEFERGRVSDRTTQAISAQLRGEVRKPLNILLCHHHPLRNAEMPQFIDYSEMRGGDTLINVLNDLDVGDWIIIHGHKHFPRIWYGPSESGRAPVVFSAGSFSVKLYSELAALARNQFYVIDFPLDRMQEEMVGVLGIVAAWDWTTSLGWLPAKERSGIADQSGFGWRENPDRVAHLIAKQVKPSLVSSGRPYFSWAELNEAMALLPFLSPRSLGQVLQSLGNTHGLHILYDAGQPSQIGLS